MERPSSRVTSRYSKVSAATKADSEMTNDAASSAAGEPPTGPASVRMSNG